MAFSENEFTLEEYVAPAAASVEAEPASLSFEEEWEQFLLREEHARSRGQAALFGLVLVDGQVQAELGEA